MIVRFNSYLSREMPTAPDGNDLIEIDVRVTADYTAAEPDVDYPATMEITAVREVLPSSAPAVAARDYADDLTDEEVERLTGEAWEAMEAQREELAEVRAEKVDRALIVVDVPAMADAMLAHPELAAALADDLSLAPAPSLPADEQGEWDKNNAPDRWE